MTTQEARIDVDELERRLKEGERLKGVEKLGHMKRLWADVKTAEALFARDFTQPFDDVRRVRKMIPALETAINRLEAARRRAKEKANV